MTTEPIYSYTLEHGQKNQERKQALKESKNSPKKVNAESRARLAIRLRRKGYGYAQIAAQLGYQNAGGAHKAVTRGMKALREATLAEADELRQLEEERLDELLVNLGKRVEAEHKRLSRLLGQLEEGIEKGKQAALTQARHLSEAHRKLIQVATRETRAISESRRRLLGLDRMLGEGQTDGDGESGSGRYELVVRRY